MVAPSVPDLVRDVKELRGFHEFFTQASGSWNTERNYHYMEGEDEEASTENSRMTFDVERLGNDDKREVIEIYDKFLDEEGVASCEGFRVSFKTMMESKGLVKSFTNLVFIPEESRNNVLSGMYLRDYAYEERRPVPGSFKFNTEERKLILTTKYTKLVSVDSIQLANSDTRLRQIVNYERPEEPDEELSKVMLAGFGVETRVQGGNRFVD
ncbi:hypothetical protein NDN08_007453 [Rhodosorus marinus]|uniref:Chromophore lyase CpcS/CpeS n=1 Tax=Rhodosorus marinus TaxID=101924 RepID=A0AAV8UXK9_9RHOD|nr:hypothetical protein NDN08_007453 [Rhodosorus marinus]